MKLTELPIFDQVLMSGQLDEKLVRLWRVVATHLDVLHFRKIPMEELERHFGVDRATIWRQLNDLVDGGWLDRAERDYITAPAMYRIPLSRATIAHNSKISGSKQDVDLTATVAQVVAKKARAHRRRIQSDDVV